MPGYLGIRGVIMATCSQMVQKRGKKCGVLSKGCMEKKRAWWREGGRGRKNYKANMVKMFVFLESGGRVYRISLHYSCNFSVSLKLCHQKKVGKKGERKKKESQRVRYLSPATICCFSICLWKRDHSSAFNHPLRREIHLHFECQTPQFSLWWQEPSEPS